MKKAKMEISKKEVEIISKLLGVDVKSKKEVLIIAAQSGDGARCYVEGPAHRVIGTLQHLLESTREEAGQEIKSQLGGLLGELSKALSQGKVPQGFRAPVAKSKSEQRRIAIMKKAKTKSK